MDPKSQQDQNTEVSHLEQLKQNFKDLGIDPNSTQEVLSRKTSPLIFDVGSRIFVGTMAGISFGFVFFKRWSALRFTSMFGLGVGLGLNYCQLNVLWHAARGTLDSSSQRNQEELRKELEDIHYEMKLRSKLKLN